MIIETLVCNGESQTIERQEVPDNFFDVPTSEPTIEERTAALEATQSDVIDVLASALGVTI